jgi:hypothetical protein
MIAAFGTEGGRRAYWPEVSAEGTSVFSRDLQSKDEPSRVGGPYPIGPNSYHHFDQTSSHFRLFETERQPVQMGEYKTSSGGVGNDSELTEEQIRNALEVLVQLQQSNMYFGDPRLNAAFFARAIEQGGAGDGALGVSSRTWEQGVRTMIAVKVASSLATSVPWVGLADVKIRPATPSERQMPHTLAGQKGHWRPSWCSAAQQGWRGSIP